MRYPIVPVPKPRQTRRDRWAQRTSVLRYRAFADECRVRITDDLDGAEITFYMPMPQSWSRKKRNQMHGTPHRQRPDIDNLAKALLDALYKDDSSVAFISLRKVWADEGAIEILSRSNRDIGCDRHEQPFGRRSCS